MACGVCVCVCVCVCVYKVPPFIFSVEAPLVRGRETRDETAQGERGRGRARDREEAESEGERGIDISLLTLVCVSKVFSSQCYAYKLSANISYL